MWSFTVYADDRVDISFKNIAVLELEGQDAVKFQTAVQILKDSFKVPSGKKSYETSLQDFIESYHTLRESDCAICSEKFYTCLESEACGKMEPILN